MNYGSDRRLFALGYGDLFRKQVLVEGFDFGYGASRSATFLLPSVDEEAFCVRVACCWVGMHGWHIMHELSLVVYRKRYTTSLRFV